MKSRTITNKFQSRITLEIVDRMAKAKIAGLLVIEESEHKSNLPCDVCGKNGDFCYVAVVIHTNKETMENDPMSGEVYIFGQTCWNKIGMRVKNLVTSYQTSM